jgi:hypothetical protein
VKVILAESLMMRRKKILVAVLACLLCGFLGQTAFAKYPWLAIPSKQYNWPKEKASDWKVKRFTDKSNAGKIHLMAQFKSSNKTFGEGTRQIPFRPFANSTQYYYVQGGVVTENKYVFAVFTSNESKENYIYFADRKDGKVVKVLKGNWGHSNTLYYVWGKDKVRVNVGDESSDKCYNVKNYKAIELSKCIGRQKVTYGFQNVLTPQGVAKSAKGGWKAAAGWDAADTYWGQESYYIRSSNAVMIYDKNNKIFRTIYIGKSAVADGISLKGEIEDVSFDGENNLYLFYNLTSTSNGAIFARISYKDWHSDPGKDENDESEDTTLDTSDDEADDLKSTEDKENDESEPEIAKTHLDSVEEGECTSLFSPSWCDKTSDSGIRNVAGFIVSILTGMVLTAGTIGVIICGYIWLTARDNAERVAMAKRRMLDIVIGIVAWGLLATLANLIIPQTEEEINSNYTSSTGQSDSGMI